MFALLNPKLWIALAIAGMLATSHFTAYRSGKATIRAEWQADVAQRTADALQASEQARKTEQGLQAKVRKATDDYHLARKNTDHLAAAASDGLRNLEAILAAPAVASSGAVAATRDHGAGGLERELLGNCAAALTELARTTDRLENKVVALQEYIRAMK